MTEVGGNGQRKPLAGIAIVSVMLPIAMTVLTQVLYGVYFGGRATQNVEGRLLAHDGDISALRMDLNKIREDFKAMDDKGTRPAQLMDARVKRVEDDIHIVAERFEKFRSDIVDQRTPLSLIVASIDKAVKDLQDTARSHTSQLNELNVRLNGFIASSAAKK